ncbi:hypothetical protein [Frankia sp. CcI49]|uniref:hypothetical protein n=1 Tax=Frankia sp. CcI49 TaxID=1745382 RepID=UPI0013041999|nr:hypothetical protein [Frankia sp. CcI49]
MRDALPGRDEWEHGPVMGTINAAGAAFTAAAVGHAADLDPIWGAVGGAAGALGAVVAGRRADLSGSAVSYRACCWAAAGGWVTRALATTPWDMTGVGMLAAGALGAGVLAPALSRHQRGEAERAARRLIIGARQARAAEWEERVDRVCRQRGTHVLGIQAWAPVTRADGTVITEPGYTVEIRLPKGGATAATIAAAAAGLASDADLPTGCGVEVRPGVRRSRVLLDVGLVNMLDIEIPYPEDYPLGSCLRPYSLGKKPNGKPAAIHTRERSGLFTGSKGSGKSNLLNVLTSRNVEMVDNLVWMIDLSGGRLVLPWMRAYLEGRATRPPLDWVAGDADEALRMCQAAHRIGTGRGKEYAGLMHHADSDMLPLSAQVPQITIIVDESKSITGQQVTSSDRTKLTKAMLDVLEECRAMGVNVHRSNLRSTGDALGGIDVRVQSDILIMMKPKTEEIAKLFDNAAGLKAEDAPHKGNGLCSQDSERPYPFMTFRTTPQAIDRCAVAVSDRRPGLDTPSARLAGPDYTTRWDRIGWLQAIATTPATVAAATGTGGTPPTSAAGTNTGDGGHESLNEALAGMTGIADQLRTERLASDTGQDNGDQDTAQAWAEIVAGWDQTAPEPTPPARRPARTTAEIRTRMLEILSAAGPAGLGASEVWEKLVAEGCERTRQAVSDWLRAAVAAGQVIQPVDRGPYIHSDHTPRDGDGQ